MKKILFLFLLIPAMSQAQLFVDFGGGVGTQSHYVGQNESGADVYANGIAPIGKISIGFAFKDSVSFRTKSRYIKMNIVIPTKNLMVEFVEMPTVTNQVNSPNFFGGKIGYNVAGSGIIPAVGYYYNLCNSDNPEYNGSCLGYSLKYNLNLNPKGGLYAEAMYIKNTYQFTAGFHVQF